MLIFGRRCNTQLKKQSVLLQSNATSEKNASIIQIRFVTEKTPWCIIPRWFVGTNSQTDYRHLVSRNLPGGQERAHRLHCSVENSGSIKQNNFFYSSFLTGWWKAGHLAQDHSIRNLLVYHSSSPQAVCVSRGRLEFISGRVLRSTAEMRGEQYDVT